ncbi:membrane protein [Marivita lacus]|uniref:Membrane protein n=1 Tax=Marivita lacus TaxID=1323742 RepID=A0ABQ1KDA3_9RHOB|nr:EamA family transporter [Marivita lacus]GGB94556.1 membrane protein [Marivita lacus]
MTRNTATSIGFVAVLLWALLALFTAGSEPVPPFLLNAMTFTIASIIGVIWVLARGRVSVLRPVPWTIYAFGTAGLFGYHALYYSALRLAPPAEAGLIAYLWPLLIVLFSGLLPGERLRTGHIVGALVSFGGAALIVSRGGLSLESAATPGLILAAFCALTWSSYSVLSRRMDDTPTEVVTVYCIATAILSVPAHLAFETTVWPDSNIAWLSVLALGLGPVGLAFYVWDIGVKRGDIQLLGVASYAAPLLSTLVLIAAGIAQVSWQLLVAAVLISFGAGIAAMASRDS